MKLFLCKFLSVILFCLWVTYGCATKVGGQGDVLLRQYPVPITFTIEAGATNNTQ
jgi:hypothetical protein